MFIQRCKVNNAISTARKLTAGQRKRATSIFTVCFNGRCLHQPHSAGALFNHFLSTWPEENVLCQSSQLFLHAKCAFLIQLKCQELGQYLVCSTETCSTDSFRHDLTTLLSRTTSVHSASDALKLNAINRLLIVMLTLTIQDYQGRNLLIDI